LPVLKKLIPIIISFVFLCSCGVKPNDEKSELTLNLPLSFFHDETLAAKKMMATIDILEVNNDSMLVVIDGDTTSKSTFYFSENNVPELKWDPIYMNFPGKMPMEKVNQIFNVLTEAKQYDLALAVNYENDSAQIGYTISRIDIPMNCCFEKRNASQEIFVLSDEVLGLGAPEIEIRNQLDSFFLGDLEEIDSLFLASNFKWLDTISKNRDTCLGFECASLHQQKQYNWKSDSSNFELIGAHFRPSINTLVDLKLSLNASYQDFITVISAHHKWLEEKRNSLAILYFNKTFAELKLAAKSDRLFQEYVFVVRMMAPYRLRYLPNKSD